MKSTSSPKKLKFSGKTPITVIGCWSIMSFLPMTPGSVLKWRFQRRCVMTMTGAALSI